jgi:membrane associated rhomboid family serine protease
MAALFSAVLSNTLRRNARSFVACRPLSAWSGRRVQLAATTRRFATNAEQPWRQQSSASEADANEGDWSEEFEEPKPYWRYALFGVAFVGATSAAAYTYEGRKPATAVVPTRFKYRDHSIYGYSATQLTLYGIMGINTIVFALWQIRSGNVQRVMSRYFLHHRASPLPAMIGSTFSHSTLGHFAFNMIALNSVAAPLLTLLPPSYFIAFYLNCGMTSAMLSHGVKSLRRSDQLSAYACGDALCNR